MKKAPSSAPHQARRRRNRGKAASSGTQAEEVEDHHSQPGKFAPVLEFFELREEEHSTLFERDFLSAVGEVHIFTERSMEQMHLPTNGRVDDYQESLLSSTRSIMLLALARKLAKTATPAQAVNIGVYTALFRSLESLELPATLLEIVDLFGNFSTEEELWRTNNLDMRVVQLLRLATDWDLRTNWDHTIVTSWCWNRLGEDPRYDEQSFRNLPFLVGANGLATRLPEAIDLGTADLAPYVAEAQPGDNVGQANEITNRATLNQRLRDPLPAQADRQATADMFEASFGRPLVFDIRAPAVLKEACSTIMEEYARRFMPPLSRVWVMASCGNLSEYGSPAQLITYSSAHRGDAPSKVDPSGYGLLALITGDVHILRRPQRSWTVTQSATAPDIRRFVTAQSMRRAGSPP